MWGLKVGVEVGVGLSATHTSGRLDTYVEARQVQRRGPIMHDLLQGSARGGEGANHKCVVPLCSNTEAGRASALLVGGSQVGSVAYEALECGELVEGRGEEERGATVQPRAHSHLLCADGVAGRGLVIEG